MTSIPTMSLVMDMKHWFDPQTGIYSNPTQAHEDGNPATDWERPVSIEFWDPCAGQDFQIKLEYDPEFLTVDQSQRLQSAEMSIQQSDKQLIISGREGGTLVVFFIKHKPLPTAIEASVWRGQSKGYTENIELN